MRISMDGRGRWMDNVFIERVWRSLKYEDVYLKGYGDGREAAGIGAYFAFYNERRLHQALGQRRNFFPHTPLSGTPSTSNATSSPPTRTARFAVAVITWRTAVAAA